MALPQGGGNERLFFALWPDGAAAQALAELAAVLAPPLAGKPVPMEKIHLTLAFLGDVPAGSVERAIAAGNAVRASAFVLSLDHVGAFSRARVAWAGSDAVPAGLETLHGELREAIVGRELPVEERAFAPHMTLVRKIGGPLPQTSLPRPISWQAGAFSLMRSELGTGRYSTLAAWDLAAR